MLDFIYHAVTFVASLIIIIVFCFLFFMEIKGYRDEAKENKEMARRYREEGDLNGFY